MKDAVALWQFVRHDPVGRWLGIAWAVVAWFALTWLSLTVTVLLLLVSRGEKTVVEVPVPGW